MKTLLVGYDLNKAKDYPKLHEALKAEPLWWHYLDSTWLVRSNSSCFEMRDKLRSLIDSDDELLVIDVTGDSAGWVGFPDRAGQWIKDNL